MFLTQLSFDDIDFDVYNSQQFATVIFDRIEDSPETDITVVKDGKIHQFKGDNRFNPSLRRWSSCVYAQEENSDKVIKICTIQHKGDTRIEIHEVSSDELEYLFR